jgi:uncharacterized protein (TIGR02391 family)
LRLNADMPYHIIKKIKTAGKGSSTYLPTFYIDLEDDKTWSLFKLYRQPAPILRGNVVRLASPDGTNIDKIDKPFEFLTATTSNYGIANDTIEKRMLYMPTKLIQAFCIEENMAIELVLTEVIYDFKTNCERAVEIFSKVVEGPKDITINENIPKISDDVIKESGEEQLRQLINEGISIRDKLPRLGKPVTFDNALTQNEMLSHQWCMKTKEFLIKTFGENSRQKQEFMDHFNDEYHFKNYLGFDGPAIKYFFDNLGKAIIELTLIADNFRGQVVNALPTDNSLLDSLQLHNKVIEVSKKLFDNGHYADAILRAFIALNESTKLKSGLDKDGFALMNLAFSEEKPILKLNELNTMSEQDEQKGFRFIFAGSMAGIRNPSAHTTKVLNDPHEALEYLALASLLFRRLDEAKK